jgi:HPt (histidine-containing phosphotransfer) domain-containing protein
MTVNAEAALQPLLRDMGNDKATVKELVEMFLTEAPDLLAKGRDAFAKKDAPGLQRAYHSLKGSSSQFGLADVAELARSIEHPAKEGKLPTQATVAALDAAWKDAETSLKAWVKATA